MIAEPGGACLQPITAFVGPALVAVPRRADKRQPYKKAIACKQAPTSRVRALGAMIAIAGSVCAAELPPQQVEFFEAKIRPILVESCYKCHGAESGKSKGGLMLDSRDALRKGGATGAVITPGDPEKSLLIEAVRYRNEDLQMPPPDEGGKLSDEKIAALEEWIRLGAPDPRTGEVRSAVLDMAEARRHWAFRPVAASAVPAVKNASWVRTPVDAFILAQLEAKNFGPAAPADRRTLLRRVTYDLTGLPPTAEEIEAFVQDRDPAAFARAVDRLLASPRYGERWGRFWLDVARYADTKGYLVGNAERRFPFAHTYRDYVIKAFNDDKPFDQFVVEQLAADRLPLGEDKSSLAALGFLTLGRRFLNNQNDIIDDRIDVVTRGLLGLTVSCARCHDHKFDPVPTEDYYSLHGIFASSMEPDENPLLGPVPDTEAYRAFLRKKSELEAKIKEREREEVDKFLAAARAKTGDYLLAAHDAAKIAGDPKLELFAGTRKLNVEVLKRWQEFLADSANEKNPVLAPWRALAALPEEGFAAKAAELIARWKHAESVAERVSVSSSGEKLTLSATIVATLEEHPPGSLKDVALIYNRLGETPGEHAALHELLYAENAPPNLPRETVATMLRREINNKTAALKREIEGLNWTEPGAPLRAMALVDRPRPQNSRVLRRGNPANRGDEVPRRFLEVLSDGERAPFTDGSGRLELARAIASPANPLTARVFVNRVWGWHFGQPLVRTPSDFGVRTEPPIHGALLDWLAHTFVTSGWSVKQLHRAIVLSSAYQQSSDLRPELVEVDPDNLLVHRFPRRRLEFEALRDTLLAAAGALDLQGGGPPDDLIKEPFSVRRSVYGFIDRQNLPGMFRTFDYPNPDTSTAQRFTTTVPQQALFMLNSPFVLEQARHVTRRPEFAAAESDAARARALYRAVLQRSPEADEASLAVEFVRAALVRQPSPTAPAIAGGWRYGYGAFDRATNRVAGFTEMTARKDGRISVSESYPDPKLGHVSLTATGGHPGREAEHASILRWIAPADGTVRIRGTLAHGAMKGDGVLGRIVCSASGSVGEWTVARDKAATDVESVAVKAGDTIDFVVECIENANSDGYTWSPTITLTAGAEMAARTWDAKKDFDRVVKPVEPLTPWQQLAQVLLVSNELAFVD